MLVPMVDIGKVVMAVSGLRMRVGMNVFSGAIPFKFMGVLVVHIMRMGVFMFEGFMFMFVFMLFCQMQPDAYPH